MLAKLTAALVVHGPLGIPVLAFINSAGIPVASGMEALVILRPLTLHSARCWPHPWKRWDRRFRKWFKRYGLPTIFIPCMLPGRSCS